MQSSLFQPEKQAMRPLRPRQLDAIVQIREAMRQGHKRIVLQAPTGFGKTLTAAHIIGQALSKGSRPMFTVPAISLVEQTYKAFKAEGIHDIGILQAAHALTNLRAQVQIASVQTIIRRGIPEVDFALLDECFPSGTMVSTPNGTVPIERFEDGMTVSNAIGIGRVQSVFGKTISQLVKVRLSNGASFRCTSDHPVFTVSGWKKAGELEVRQGLFSEEALSCMWDGVQARHDFNGTTLRSPNIRSAFQQAEMLLQLLCKEIKQPDAQFSGSRHAFGITATDGIQADTAGGERSSHARIASEDSGFVGRRMDGRAGGKNASQAADVSASLQAGPRQSGDEDWDRVGWWESFLYFTAGTRSEERRTVPLLWVASVEVEELGSPEFVYNLRVSGHPSYFANGVLVHNCHEQFDGLNEVLDSEAWKNKIVIGLSATPWAKGMGLRWTKLVIAGTIHDMIAEGHATPAVIYGPERDLNRSSIKVQAGEFQEKASAAAMSDINIVGDVLKEWREKSPREKTFAFCVNRDHAKVQMEAFHDAGIPFGYIDALVPQEERTRIFRQMKYGEIAGIASVGCLIRGVDEDVRCILDLQPTKSEMRHVQKWGRGVRCADGKDILVGLDHAGNNEALGLFTDIYHDRLDDRKPSDRGDAYKEDYKPAKPRKCGKCHNLIPANLRACPACKEKVPLNPGVTMVDGRLVEIKAGSKLAAKARQEDYSNLLWFARRHNLKDGWAAYRYRALHNDWPKGLRVRAKEPSDAVKHQFNEERKAYLAKKKEVVA